MQHAIINSIIVFWIMLGMIECFFGYRIFKIILGIAGFMLGGAMAYNIGHTITQNEIVMLFISFIGGCIGAGLMVWIYFLGVFFIGALLGGIIGTALFSVVQIYPAPIVLFIFSMICGVLALSYQKLMIILGTSFAGSWYVAAGIVGFMEGSVGLRSMDRLFRPSGRHVFMATLIWLALGILGFVFQYTSAQAAPINHKKR